MNRRFFLFEFVTVVRAAGQEPTEPPVEFICPMDPEVRSARPGRCPRCGMTLVAGIPDGLEYPLSLSFSPAAVRAGETVRLTFRISDPKTGRPVADFVVMHEKLFHLFLVSQDLEFFLHDHPRMDPRGAFTFDAVLPRPGMYRALSDFYPRGGTPQLIAKTIIVPGGDITPGSVLAPDVSPRKGVNLEVSLQTEPARPLAGTKTMLFFELNPAEGIELYLGAWGHMLAVSGDLIDMIHTHPFLGDGGPRVQFNLIFPRPGVHRVWVQFQRKGQVNTVAFDVPAFQLGTRATSNRALASGG